MTTQIEILPIHLISANTDRKRYEMYVYVKDISSTVVTIKLVGPNFHGYYEQAQAFDSYPINFLDNWVGCEIRQPNCVDIRLCKIKKSILLIRESRFWCNDVTDIEHWKEEAARHYLKDVCQEWEVYPGDNL